MHHTVAVVLLGLCSIAGLVLVALGLPGLWLICAAALVLGLLTGFHAIGFVTIAIMVGLARRYGGSPRAGWGALLGGLLGAVVGVPVPVVGSVIAAILGCFAGAAIFEYATTRRAGTAVRAGWGALLGRVAASAAKVALGIVMTIVAIIAALEA